MAIQLINQFAPANREMLENMQGNILKAHGREHTANFFFNAKEGKKKEFKKWMLHLATSGLVQSCYDQLRDIQRWKTHKIDGGTFAVVHISAKGYEYLLEDIKPARVKLNAEFENGMNKSGLGDDEKDFEEGIKDESQFLLILADNNIDALEQQIEIIELQLANIANIEYIQRGDAIKNAEGAGIEHFGYVDGISQPIFFEDELTTYKKQNGSPTKLTYDPSADKGLVLVQDPYTKEKNPEAFGSYLVFRKLEQDVYGFKKAEEKLAKQLNLEGEDAERAGAYIVGRFEDGTPVEVSKDAGLLNNSVINDFDFKADDASKCPYHAHIRKTNPRSEFDKLGDAKSHVMARRGIPFGKRADSPMDGVLETKPRGGVGLLFMSYQNSISKQFEVIQNLWANKEDFFKGETGLDLIIGNGDYPSTSDYPKKWGEPENEKASFGKFVTTRGGGYYFAPSMVFLKEL
ncbi:MAG: Dyp-type peroxidase [Arcicella sp.]|nr:Dyp-type peroxidase [Arcicella sp.]